LACVRRRQPRHGLAERDATTATGIAAKTPDVQVHTDRQLGERQISQSTLVVAMYSLGRHLASRTVGDLGGRVEVYHHAFGSDIGSSHLEGGANWDEEILEQHLFLSSI
jgi:hypothetical protein